MYHQMRRQSRRTFKRFAALLASERFISKKSILRFSPIQTNRFLIYRCWAFFLDRLVFLRATRWFFEVILQIRMQNCHNRMVYCRRELKFFKKKWTNSALPPDSESFFGTGRKISIDRNLNLCSWSINPSSRDERILTENATSEWAKNYLRSKD